MGYPESMSPDTVSSLFPDRPIRPLPKRRLRERLSPGVADSIKYPPAPHSTTPLFYDPYHLKEEETEPINHVVNRERPDPGQNYVPRGSGASEITEGEAQARRSLVNRARPDMPSRPSRLLLKVDQNRTQAPQPLPSTASSVDGYDSFEHSNNKKKRKIPTVGESALNSNGHLLNDLGAGGVAAAAPIDAHADIPGVNNPQSYASGAYVSNNQPVSGPGRGRYGRVRQGRSPLRALSDANSNWAGRNGKLRPTNWSPQISENTGIISSAIANAEKLTSHPGQENISLLRQEPSARSSPGSSQFTFTCDSQVPGVLTWPGSDARSSSVPFKAGDIAKGKWQKTQSTQTAYPSPPGSQPVGAADSRGLSQEGAVKGQNPQQPRSPQRKSRRRAARELVLAARERKRQTEAHNMQYPPRPEDIWICEFCEYERIFGEPPEALIRQYEIKDRRQRQQEGERRRLLEKAKARGRKGKKGTKAATKNAAPVQDRGQGQAGSQQQVPMSNDQSQGTQSEEYYEEDYDEEEDVVDYRDEAQDDLPPLQSQAVGGHPGGGIGVGQAGYSLGNGRGPDGI